MRELKKEVWPDKVRIKSPTVGYHLNAENIEFWLGQNVGGFKDKWNVIYNGYTVDYYFRDSETATFFSLRWT